MTSPNLAPTIPHALQTDLERLRQLNTQNIQPYWHQHAENIAFSDLFAAHNPQQWAIAPLNDREHIAWEKGRNSLWLYQTITVPTDFYGYPLTGLILRLALTWWADDAQIYVDGTLVQSGDLFECFTRICLSSDVAAGQVFQVALRLVSPGHDNGALVRSHLIYELPARSPTPEPSFIADELTVLATLEPTSQGQIQEAIAQLDWNSLTQTNALNQQTSSLDLWNNLSKQSLTATTHPFQQSLSQLRRTLSPFSEALKQRQIDCIGHAHLDMAWLWPIVDTWDAAERTFRSILNLQQDFPELTYTHSSPALFEWIENNRPELFRQIQQKVKEGSWSIDAGLWVEPEFNVVSGEAIARHILYGQRYCQQKFGHISKIAWLPDSFGFCWQLPQLLTQGGIETFATLKLSWNDTTQFPHQLFWWQSPDGSRILSLMLPPIGTDIDPIKMSNHVAAWEKNTGITNTLWLPGMGDHGGGPTRDMLEKFRRWKQSPFFPQLNFTSVNHHIDKLPLPPSELNRSSHPTPLQENTLPTWKNELYLELHRGCYTTHADQKRHNRQCEDLLYQTEVFATIAQLTANQPYPKTDIDAAWKKLLFNQFHDILPGTSIAEVFIDANHDWKSVQTIGNQILHQSIEEIVSTLNLPKPPHPEAIPVIVFNSLSWQRSAVINLLLPEDMAAEKQLANWIVYGSNQQIIPHQKIGIGLEQQNSHNILFLASKIPAIGYQCFWIRHAKPSKAPLADTQSITEYDLENEFLRASIDPTTGQILSLIEKSTQKETFSTPGNQLQTFRDQGEYWDAWNIAPDYAEKPLSHPKLSSIQWIETGPIRQRIRITYQFNKSTISQDYILDADTPFLTVENTIAWQETQVLLKVNFPLTVSSNIATYEIPFGAITRTTKPKTEAEKAQWEVPALRWADLSHQNQTFGTSILTNSKHGFDASHHHLRLTLLKSPIWPDPNADKGKHHFTYAIYPHPNTWQSARTVQQARGLNIPPIIHWPKTPTDSTSQESNSVQSFLHIHNSNLVLSALKPSENNPNEFILRCYEAHGETTMIKTENTLGLTALEESKLTNLLEQAVERQQTTHIHPWQIATYHVQRIEKTQQ